MTEHSEENDNTLIQDNNKILIKRNRSFVLFNQYNNITTKSTYNKKIPFKSNISAFNNRKITEVSNECSQSNSQNINTSYFKTAIPKLQLPIHNQRHQTQINEQSMPSKETCNTFDNNNHPTKNNEDNIQLRHIILNYNSLSNSNNVNILSPRDSLSTNSLILTTNKFINEQQNNSALTVITHTCIICEQNYPYFEIITTSLCIHTFCINCIQTYFETLIINHNINDFTKFKCPISSCHHYFSSNIVIHNLPESYITYCNNKTGPLAYSLRNISNIKSYNDQTYSFEPINIYNQKYILDYSDNNSKHFFIYCKNKINKCPKCKNDNELFYKKGLHYLICFNCLTKYCKYCKEEYYTEHLYKENVKHCKVFYKGINIKTNKSKYHKQNKPMCILIYLRMILYICASFFVVLIGYNRNICISIYSLFGLDKYKIKYRCITYCLYMIILIVLLPLLTVILFISIPYFPIYTLMFY